MSMLGAGFDSAISIAQRRAGKPLSGLYAGRSSRLVERSLLAIRSSTWFVVLSGFVEPVFYLFAFGFGIGQLIGGITDGNGNAVSYSAWIAPALLATSAMNGAIFDSTWNVFFKMHFSKLYNAMLATSMGPLDVALGEISWALIRGAAYAFGFLVVATPLGLIQSWWGLLALPAALLIAFGFASFGMAITSYFKSIHQMQLINLFILPMFLFSGTFFPLDQYPAAVQAIVQALPLWQGVELIRALTLGLVNIELLWHVLYFAVMIVLGLFFTTKRLNALFMK